MNATMNPEKSDKKILYTLTQEFDENRLKLLFTCGAEIYGRIHPKRESKHTLTLIKKLFKAQKGGKLEVSVYEPYDGSRESDFGRKQSSGIDIFRLKKEFRSFICKNGPREIIDLDIGNCHPHLLLWIGEGLEKNTKYLSHYLNHKHEVREYVASELNVSYDEAKTIILASINGGDTRGSVPCEKIKSESRNILRATIDADLRAVDAEKLWRATVGRGRDGRFKRYGAMLLQTLENMCLECLELACKELDVQIFSLCFDGIMVYANDEVAQKICLLSQEFLNKLFQCSIPWDVSVKPFGCELDYLEEFVGKSSVEWYEAGLTDMFFAQNDEEASALFQKKYGNDFLMATAGEWYKRDGFRYTWMNPREAEMALWKCLRDMQIHTHDKKGNPKLLAGQSSVKSSIMKDIVRTWEIRDIDFENHGWIFFNNGGWKFSESKFYMSDELVKMGIKTDVWIDLDCTEAGLEEKMVEWTDLVGSILRSESKVFLEDMANIVSGLYPQKYIRQIIGGRDSGKTTLMLSIINALGAYAGTFKGMDLDGARAESTERQLGFLLSAPRARLRLSDETPDKPLNGGLVKMLMGGYRGEVRQAYGHNRSVDATRCAFYFTGNSELKFTQKDCREKLVEYCAQCKWCSPDEIKNKEHNGGFNYLVKDDHKRYLLTETKEYSMAILMVLFKHFKADPNLEGKGVLVNEQGGNHVEDTTAIDKFDKWYELSDDDSFISLQLIGKVGCMGLSSNIIRSAILKKYGIEKSRLQCGGGYVWGFRGFRPKYERVYKKYEKLMRLAPESMEAIRGRAHDESDDED